MALVLVNERVSAKRRAQIAPSFQGGLQPFIEARKHEIIRMQDVYAVTSRPFYTAIEVWHQADVVGVSKETHPLSR
jgi:hypothetical protein